MKIGIIASGRGGHLRWAVDLAKELCELDDKNIVKLLLIGGNEREPILDTVDNNRISVYQLKFPYTSLLRFFSSRNSDIIHINSAITGIPAILYRFFIRTPIVFTMHGVPGLDVEKNRDFDENMPFLTKLLYKIERMTIPIIAKRVDSLNTPSNYSKTAISHVYNLNPTVVYNGVNTTLFYKQLNIEQAKKKLNIAVDTKILIFIPGRLIPGKDPLTLINAMLYIIEKYPNTKVIIIGKGSLQSDIEKKARELSCDKNLQIFSDLSQEELRMYLNASDVYVGPSLSEAFGLAYVEAMACKVPVLAARAYAVPEILGDAGLLFEPGDAEGLAKNVIKILDNPEFAKELGEKGYNRVVNNFTVERFAKEYYEVYKKVLEGNI